MPHVNLGCSPAYEAADVEGADREYKSQARTINPDQLEAHGAGSARASSKPASTDLEGAVREYEAAIKSNPNYSIAHRDLGEALLDKNDIEGAIRELHTALEINPDYSEFHWVLARCLQAKNDREGAIREFQAAINLDPNYATAHYDLARCLDDMHDADGAIREFQVAIKVFPHYALPGELNFPQAHFRLGHALRSKNDEEGAFREYQASLRIDPNDASGHNWVAWELATHPELKICDPGQAVNLAKRAVELDPKESVYWTTLGAAYYRAGDWKEAVAALEKSSRALNARMQQLQLGSSWRCLTKELGDKEKRPAGVSALNWATV